MPIKISIITAVLNGYPFIEEAIRSVIYQDYPYKEYLIIDGNSTDKTVDVIKKYQEKIDYWVSEPDSGIYDAMNKGIKKSTGEVIGILNSDDLLNDNVLENIASLFNKNPNLDYAYGYIQRIRKSGEVYGKAESMTPQKIQEEKFNRIPIPHGALFVKKKLFLELGFYNTDYIINADYDFILKIIQKNKTGKYIHIPISRYRDGGISSGYLTFWERRILLKNHGVSLFKKEVIVAKSIFKMFLSRLIPHHFFLFLRNKIN